MASIVLGCDSNGVNDKECQNTVAKILEKAGYTVKKLPIAPGPFANYSYSSEAKGKIGVYLMAGSLVSFLDGANSNFDCCYFGIRGDVSEYGKEKGFNSKGVPKDKHGDCPASLCDKWAGKTFPELNEAFRGKSQATYGATHEELGNNLASIISGGSPNQSQNQDDNSDDEEEWDDKDNFTPHKGRIMEIKPYKEISSISFDKSYDSPTGSGSVEILYKSKDYRFIYKGVAMKLKLRRSCDKQWTATGVEEPNYDENEKFFKEHIPTEELLNELGLPNYRKGGVLMKSNISNSSNSDDDEKNNSSTSNNIGLR